MLGRHVIHRTTTSLKKSPLHHTSVALSLQSLHKGQPSDLKQAPHVLLPSPAGDHFAGIRSLLPLSVTKMELGQVPHQASPHPYICSPLGDTRMGAHPGLLWAGNKLA